MLRYKIKETILLQGHASPQQWLITRCGFTRSKAFLIIKNNRKAVNLEDMGVICAKLNCWPNDLYYWDNTSGRPLPPDHPCLKLALPHKLSNWSDVLNNLSLEQIEDMRRIAEQKLNENKDKNP